MSQTTVFDIIPTIHIIKLVLSILILIPYGLLFFVYGFRARFATLAHKFAFQLFTCSIIYSLSYLFPLMTEEDAKSAKCIIQGGMNIFGEMSVLFITSLIAVFTYFSYTKIETLSRNFRYIVILNVTCWVIPLIFVIIIAAFGQITVDKTRTCWFHEDALITQGVYISFCILAFINSCVLLFRLKCLIKKDLTEDDNLQMYPRFVKKINIQIVAQFITYILYLIWLVFDKQVDEEEAGNTWNQVVLGIAELGEVITGIVIPLCYGFSQEFYDEVLRLFCCKSLPGPEIREVKKMKRSTELATTGDLIDQTTTHLIEQADEEMGTSNNDDSF